MEVKFNRCRSKSFSIVNAIIRIKEGLVAKQVLDHPFAILKIYLHSLIIL